MKKMQTLSRVQKMMAGVGVVCLLGAVCFLSGMFWSSRGGHEAQMTSRLISEQLNGISELATVEYRYTNMGKFENRLDFYGWQVPLTKKSFIISYDGKMKAGFDMTAVDVKVKQEQIVITLPEAKILSHEINQHSITVFDETKNIFNPITLTDYKQFSIDQQAATEKKAIEGGLLQEAQTKAQSSITQLLNLSDDLKNRYEIVYQ